MSDTSEYYCIECMKNYDSNAIKGELFCDDCGGKLDIKQVYQPENLHDKRDNLPTGNIEDDKNNKTTSSTKNGCWKNIMSFIGYSIIVAAILRSCNSQ